MTVNDLIRQCVDDAIMETGYAKSGVIDALRSVQWMITDNAIKRFSNPLVYNKLRELLKERKRKAE